MSISWHQCSQSFFYKPKHCSMAKKAIAPTTGALYLMRENSLGVKNVNRHFVLYCMEGVESVTFHAKAISKLIFTWIKQYWLDNETMTSRMVDGKQRGMTSWLVCQPHWLMKQWTIWERKGKGEAAPSTM